jgi:hypothetical protein
MCGESVGLWHCEKFLARVLLDVDGKFYNCVLHNYKIIFAEWCNLKTSSRRSDFDFSPVCVGLGVDKISLGQIFSENFGFPLPLPFYYRSTLDCVQCKQLTASLKRVLLNFKPLSSQNLDVWVMWWDTPVSIFIDCRITLFRFSKLYFLWYFSKFCLVHLRCPGEYWKLCLTLISLHAA